MKVISLIRTRDGSRVLLMLVLFALVGIGRASDVWAKPKVHTVVIEAMKFSPEVTEVSAGDSVVWINKDPFPHNVVADNRAFHSREIATNSRWKMKATRKGSIAYVCTLHPTMKGTLVVK